MRALFQALAALGCLAAGACLAQGAAGPPPLVLERTIPLPRVSGRLDHLALDTSRKRLFVAELGNGSVEAVDLTSGRVLGRIAGLKEPQGLGYLPARDELVVATGGDGMLRFYSAADQKLIAQLRLGDDADNVRVDDESGRVLVGYGRALAVVDPGRRAVIQTISLPAHPEGFQLFGPKAFVNLPDANKIAVVDLSAGRVVELWPNPQVRFNFPMAIERQRRLIAVAYRLLPKLVLFDAADGKVRQELGACGDADDAFFSPQGARLYVICGSGSVDVFEPHHDAYSLVARIPSRSGARTGLYSGEFDRLYVAARAEGSTQAGVFVFRPTAPRR